MAKKVVLLVDDERSFLEGLVDALEFEGYQVLTATTGEDALLILTKAQVDLVCVDVMMAFSASVGTISSERGGVHLVKEIRRILPNIDIFCLSVVTDRATIAEVRHHGAIFFRKGETPLRTLIERIRSKVTGIAYSDKGWSGSDR